MEVSLKATPSRAGMLPGHPTDVWTFQGRVVRGDPRTLEDIPSGALGPTFRVRTGERVPVVLSSDIDEETIVHWHGLHVPLVADGHPGQAIARGAKYVYEFEVKGPAGTYWYHAHPSGTLVGPGLPCALGPPMQRRLERQRPSRLGRGTGGDLRAADCS